MAFEQFASVRPRTEFGAYPLGADPKKDFDRVLGDVYTKLLKMQKRARARTLSMEDCSVVLKRAIAFKWAANIAGHVKANLGKPAETDAIVACVYQNILYVAVGRGPTRPQGDDELPTVDTTVRVQLGAPDWIQDVEARAERFATWIRFNL